MNGKGERVRREDEGGKGRWGHGGVGSREGEPAEKTQRTTAVKGPGYHGSLRHAYPVGEL